MSEKKSHFSTTLSEEPLTALHKAYNYFNIELFDNQLPKCSLRFSSKKNTKGFFSSNRWIHLRDQSKGIHEISLSHYTLSNLKFALSVLVHQMVHLWQWEFGTPSRNGYHNREWAVKLEDIGLIPTDTGKVGGKKTGQFILHYINEGGKYDIAYCSIPRMILSPFNKLVLNQKSNLSLSHMPDKHNHNLRENHSINASGKKKTKYCCPLCKSNVWGKPSLKIICGSCNIKFEVT